MPAHMVLDSWALLAWLLDQPAAGPVQSLLERAERGEISLSMSWLSAAEVYYMAARKLGADQAEVFLTRLPSLPLRLELPDAADVLPSNGSAYRDRSSQQIG